MAEMIMNQHQMAANQDLLKSQNRELARMIFDVIVDQSDMKIELKTIKTDVAELKTDVAGLRTGVAELKTEIGELDGKVDLILNILRSKN